MGQRQTVQVMDTGRLLNTLHKAWGCLWNTDWYFVLSIAARFYVGQNLYISYSKGSTPNGQQNWAAAVQAWYDEVKDFNKNNVSPFQWVCLPQLYAVRLQLILHYSSQINLHKTYQHWLPRLTLFILSYRNFSKVSLYKQFMYSW
jgi:hypothetical protein